MRVALLVEDSSAMFVSATRRGGEAPAVADARSPRAIMVMTFDSMSQRDGAELRGCWSLSVMPVAAAIADAQSTSMRTTLLAIVTDVVIGVVA